jgi:hypothetical protein
MPKKRTRYSNYIKDQVKKRYPLCRTTEDKEKLADELGIGSVSKLYNLASRLGAAATDLQPGDHLDAHSNRRLLEREDPDEINFSAASDRYLRSEFGRRGIEDIAYHLKHSETAILYRARKLGLRKPVKYWRTSKVALWFDMELNEFHKIKDLDVYPLYYRNGEEVFKVVSTSSLARYIENKKNLDSLNKRNPDKFFLLELQESVQDLVEGEVDFESCKFLSHGHVCQNPYTESSFGFFCTNNEKYFAGEDPACRVRHLEIEDLDPNS